MKRIAYLLPLLCIWFAVLGSALPPPITGNVRLYWNFDTNQEPVSTNSCFNFYGCTNLQTSGGFSNWPIYTNINAAAAWDTNLAVMHIDLNLTPSQYFFVATESNFWGESSITSNICAVPAPPQVINQSLGIQKLP